MEEEEAEGEGEKDKEEEEEEGVSKQLKGDREQDGMYLWTLPVLQNLPVSFFGGEESSAASVQVLKHKKKG